MSFLPVPDYEDLYEVNEQGTVCSLDRVVVDKNGIQYPRRGRILRASPCKNIQYLVVSLWKGNVGTSHYVHRLVAQAHIPNSLNLPEVNHIDGNRQNNFKDNLEWVTRLKNVQHAIQTGLRIYTNRLTKEEFVACLFDVIDGESYASLSKRVPYKVPFLSIKLRELAQELNLEAELDISLHLQRIRRAQVNGAKNS